MGRPRGDGDPGALLGLSDFLGRPRGDAIGPSWEVIDFLGLPGEALGLGVFLGLPLGVVDFSPVRGVASFRCVIFVQTTFGDLGVDLKEASWSPSVFEVGVAGFCGVNLGKGMGVSGFFMGVLDMLLSAETGVG